MISTILVLVALIFALLATFNAPLPRINLIGAALAAYFASLLVGHL